MSNDDELSRNARSTETSRHQATSAPRRGQHRREQSRLGLAHAGNSHSSGELTTGSAASRAGGEAGAMGTSVREHAPAALPRVQGERVDLEVSQASITTGAAAALPAQRRQRSVDAPATPQPTAGSTEVASPSPKFRPDIEGLRALAVLAVVLYHAGITQLHGGFIGVDVFFVISGFLITSQLLAEVATTGTVRLRNFWARRARRLLPAVATLLAVTSVVVIAVWPALRRANTLMDIAVAALYGANWRFISTNVEYGATAGRSPVLHLWSLGVEEQFYLVWPLLVLACAWLARRRWSFTKALTISVGTVWVVSFAFSWMISQFDAVFAYFSLPTRAWQLASGALLALAVTQLGRVPVLLRVMLGWAGLAGIAVAVLTLVEGAGTPYPGTAALLPTMAAMAVIASGLGGVAAFGPVALLRWAPLQVMGRLSYGWYLWHWPFVVLAPAVLNRPVSISENIALSLAALGVAWVSFRVVENPIRHSKALALRPKASLVLGAALTVLPALVAVVLISKAAPGAVTHTVQAARADAPVVQARPTPQPGPTTGQREQHVQLSPLQASSDKGLVNSHCQVGRTAIVPADHCTFAARASANRVLLVGDSHASHWFPALEQVAKNENLALTAWTKSWCQFTDVPLLLDGQPYTACQQWRLQVLSRIQADPPSLVLVSGVDVLSNNRAYSSIEVADPVTGQAIRGQQAQQVWSQGFERMLTQVRATGAQVVVIADTPVMSHLVPSCLAETQAVDSCSTARERALPTGQDARVARSLGVPVWDFTDRLCGPRTCSAVVNDLIVWWDRQHMTASFAATLAPQMQQYYQQLPR